VSWWLVVWGSGAHREPASLDDGDPSPEPGEVGAVTLTGVPLTLEDVVGLGQDQCVRAPGAPGHVVYGQFGPVDSPVDMLAAK
jgi:hypothetical protein